MSRKERKQDPIVSKGRPSESDQRVLKRAETPLSDEAPNVGGVDQDAKIEPVDLSLHGDGIDHWQDELPSKRNARGEREGEIPKKREKR